MPSIQLKAGRFLFWSICALSLGVGRGYQKISCDGSRHIHDCIHKFENLAFDPNTKMIFIHIRDVELLYSTEFEMNVILEYVWVNKSSLHYLSYPDEFQALSFGLLGGYIYEFDIHLPLVLPDPFDVLWKYPNPIDDVISTVREMISNGTNGSLC